MHSSIATKTESNFELMEIKGYKFAQNKSFADCISGCIPAVLTIATSSIDENTLSCKSLSSIQVIVISFLKKFLVSKVGWGYKLLKTLVQDTKDE